MTYTDEELVPTTSPLQHGTSGRFACSPIEREITRSSWSPGAQHSWSAAQPTPFLVHKSARSASQLYPSDRHRPRSPFMQAMSITKEVIRTTPPGSGRIGSTPTSPSFARMSRVHFWSNLLAQQDIADRGQTKSNSRRSSRGSSSRSSSSRSSPNTPELLQHRNTIESLSVEPPGKSCPELPRSKGETTERHLAESFSCNGRVEHIHIGSPPSGAATKDRFSTPSGSALAQPGTSAPLAAPCISAPTSTQLPPSLATSGSPGNSCDRKSQDSFVAQAVRDQLEAASESKPSHARSIPCAPEQRSSSSHDPIRSNASLSPTHSIHSHFTRQPSMRRAPSKSQVAGLEVGMNKSGPKVGLRTSAILRTRQSAPGCFY
uniref:Uncharacterized protein n=1 Tax=Dunaliella tertiolecta TaxID=3047 RepID=A0A7S3QXU1_DUNTE|mmetsp:Transcript_31785/g.82619  ORF Transcript_31785/g.82619 Transcript_31785/m.82619 type:complete len:375 (+) Transcript_31785:73-1197(+)